MEIEQRVVGTQISILDSTYTKLYTKTHYDGIKWETKNICDKGKFNWDSH